MPNEIPASFIPVRWLRHRMSFWLDEHGQPLPAPGVQQAAARLAQRAEAAAAAAERDAQARQIDGERVLGDLVRDVAWPAVPGFGRCGADPSRRRRGPG